MMETFFIQMYRLLQSTNRRRVCRLCIIKCTSDTSNTINNIVPSCMTDLAPPELNPSRKPTQGSGRSYNRRLDKSVRLLIHEWHYWWQVVPVYYVFNDPDSLHAQLCRLEDQDLRRSNEKGLYIYGRRNVQSARWVPKCEVNVKRNSKETLPAWSNMCFAHDTQENSFSTGKLAPRKNAGAWCRASSPDHFSHCTSFPRFVYIRGQEQGVRIQLSKEPDFCRSRKTFRWPADRWDSTSCRFGAPKLRVPKVFVGGTKSCTFWTRFNA